MTACDTAFRILALRYLGDLTANHEATCKGDPEALHQMRVVLTRLRTAVLFFSPMIVDSQQPQVKGELKWLNTNLGVVRDLDVAIERLEATVEGTRLLDRFLQRGQTGAVAAKTTQEEPKASETGHQETASAASPEQKVNLFDRILRRLVS